jgi:multidrug efflux pump subunit AcrA (membrane-fusion protein)
MSMRVSAKNLGLAACAVALVAAGFVLLGSSVDRAAPTPAANAPALPVPVVPVIRRTVPVYLDFVGTTEAIRSVSLQARVTGYLVEQGVPDGADVKSASLLYRIDPRPYQAALDQVIANRAHDQANLENAELNFRRDTALLPRQLAVTPAAIRYRQSDSRAAQSTDCGRRCRHRDGAAQCRLYRNPGILCRSHRQESGA